MGLAEEVSSGPLVAHYSRERLRSVLRTPPKAALLRSRSSLDNLANRGNSRMETFTEGKGASCCCSFLMGVGGAR